MMNSPKVHLGITRSHAGVEHKNLFIFSYKNHLDRFIINTKQFIIKDLHSNCVQILGKEARHDITHKISKIQLQIT
jgi:hypothetical protein